MQVCVMRVIDCAFGERIHYVVPYSYFMFVLLPPVVDSILVHDRVSATFHLSPLTSRLIALLAECFPMSLLFVSLSYISTVYPVRLIDFSFLDVFNIPRCKLFYAI